MASLRQLRRRIKSVHSTRQITRAMQMVAASKMRKADALLKSSRPYADKLRDILSHLVAIEDLPDHPLLHKQPGEKIGLVIVSGEKGLCGAFNTHIIKKAEEFIESHSKNEVVLHIMGKKALEYFRRRSANIGIGIDRVGKILDEARINEIAGEILSGYPEKTDTFYILYTSFVSAVSYRPTLDHLVPFDRESFQETSVGSETDYIFEPDASELFGKLLPKYFENRIYLALAESVTSEHSARMVSMKNATDNASELIEKLTLLRNKIRQATITKEISEIVGGAEALK